MIVPYENIYLNDIIEIWLHSNIQAHFFIPKKYWMKQYETVKLLLPQSEIFVFEENHKIKGFIGITQAYIAGLFVLAQYRGKGIGKKLLEYSMKKYKNMTLDVYEKNVKAVRFYKVNGFIITKEYVEEQTNERAYKMLWDEKH